MKVSTFAPTSNYEFRRPQAASQEVSSYLANDSFVAGPVPEMTELYTPQNFAVPTDPVTPEQIKGMIANPELRRRYEQMTPAEQAKFAQVVEKSSDDRKELPRDLTRLLGSNKLTERDAKGGTTLDSLARLASTPRADGLDNRQVLNEVAARVANPSRIFQSDRGTCTMTSAEYVLASKKPAEFARVMEGITSQSQSVQLAGGKTLATNASSLAGDKTNRASADRIFQSSMMDFSNGIKYSYDNTNDTQPYLTNGSAKITSLFVKTRGSGLNADETAYGLGQLLGDTAKVNGFTDSPAARSKFEKDSVAPGTDTIVSIKWGEDKLDTGEKAMGNHQLVVKGFFTDADGKQYVELWNPWGRGTREGIAEKKEPTTMKVQRIVDDGDYRAEGTLRMEADEFFKRVNHYETVRETEWNTRPVPSPAPVPGR